MLTTVVADLVARSLMRDSLMTRKLARRGVHVPIELHTDALRGTLVADAMSTDIETIDRDTTVGDAIARFRQSRHHALPIVDNGACVAILTEHDVLRERAPTTALALTIATHEVLLARPDQSVLSALETMVHEDIKQLPVVADRRGVGLCSRLDILRVSEAQAERETAQPGWIHIHVQRTHTGLSRFVPRRHQPDQT